MKSKVKQCLMWSYNRYLIPGLAIAFLIRSLGLEAS